MKVRVTRFCVNCRCTSLGSGHVTSVEHDLGNVDAAKDRGVRHCRSRFRLVHPRLLFTRAGRCSSPSRMGRSPGRVKGACTFFDTRIISSWAIYANGEPWELLNGGPISYYSARIFLTSKTILTADGPIPPRTLGLTISRSIGGGLHEDLEMTNNSMKPLRFQLEVPLPSDLADA